MRYGDRNSVRKGKTSVLSAEEMHELLAAIDTTSLLGLRDRALIALMGYTFARVGAANACQPHEGTRVSAGTCNQAIDARSIFLHDPHSNARHS
jgi:hypothetical protein